MRTLLGWTTNLLRAAPAIIAAAAGISAPAQNQLQSNAPHVAYLYPAGAERGTTIILALGGQRLRGPESLHLVPADGITVEFVDFERTLSPKELNEVRERIKALTERRTAANRGVGSASWSEADEKLLEDLRDQTLRRPNRLTSPALADTARFRLTIAPDAACGPREIRLRSATGLSNPLVFQLGSVPEFAEPLVKATGRRNQPGTRPRAPISVDLPCVINGQVLGGEIDRFTFAGFAGQQLTLVVQARALMPYLADAVPGWFQATLALHDENGRELAYRDDFRFHPDPVLTYTLPADGLYTIEIKDAIFRGREDFVYRITAGELPFITSVFPLGTSTGEKTPFALRGWNIAPDAKLVALGEPDHKSRMVAVLSGGHLSNSARVHVSDLRGAMEPVAAAKGATPAITLPALIDGRIGTPGEVDVFEFSGRAGERIVAEVLARRFDSPLDSLVELVDANGAVLIRNDDWEDKAAGLVTHHADSRVEATLPQTGAYRIVLRDTQHHGGAEYGYRLRVSAPRPDFELRVTPATLNARAGGSVPLTVHALRRDGFDGEIALGLIDAPGGVALSGARIPAGQERIQLTLTVSSAHGRQPQVLKIAGRAQIDDRMVYRIATPAEDMMQAFAYQHLVPARELVMLAATRGIGLRTSESKIELAPDSQAIVHLRSVGLRSTDILQVELLDPPPGIRIVSTKPTFDGIKVTLACDARATPSAGNLIFAGSYLRSGENERNRSRRSQIGCSPAIPFEIRAQPTVALH